MAKLKRNDPCSCGSGKKYKKCCLQVGEQKRYKNPPPPIKISEAIIQLVQPLLDTFTSEKRIRPLISMAVLAWNLSIASAENREKIKNETLEKLPKEMWEEKIEILMEQLDKFIASKQLLFPDIDYFIVDYNLSFDVYGNYTLDVNSTEKCLKDQ